MALFPRSLDIVTSTQGQKASVKRAANLHHMKHTKTTVAHDWCRQRLLVVVWQMSESLDLDAGQRRLNQDVCPSWPDERSTNH